MLQDFVGGINNCVDKSIILHFQVRNTQRHGLPKIAVRISSLIPILQ